MDTICRPLTTESEGLVAITQLRKRLWAKGYRPVAICAHDSDPERSPGKRPIGQGWELRARATPPEAARKHAVAHGPNTGILCDGLRVIDVDVDDEKHAKQVYCLALVYFGMGPVRHRRNSAKITILYRAAEGQPRKRAISSDYGKVEVLGYGQQFVAFGTHVTGAALEWRDGSPETVSIDQLVAVTEDEITAFLEEVRAYLGTSACITATRGEVAAVRDLVADIEDLRSAISVIPNAGPTDWDAWNRMGMMLWAATEGDGEGFELFHDWSEQHDSFNPEAVEERWAHYANSPPNCIGAGTLFHMAREACPGWQIPSMASTGGAEFIDAPLPAEPPAVVVLSEITHAAAGDSFADNHVGRYLFDHDEKRWFVFRAGVGWEPQRHQELLLAMRTHIKKGRAQCGETRSLSAGNEAFAPAALRIVESDPRYATSARDWDSDPMLLGVPGGHVDLRTGKLHPADPARRMQRRTTVAPDGLSHPVWSTFLHQSTGGDADFTAFLQRLAGYWLTGDVREEMFAFMYGPGSNGKGTFLQTICSIMGTYAYQAPTEIVKRDTRADRSGHLAKLLGVRLLSVSETEPGDGLAEAFIKEITGNEGEINARHLYGRPFTFSMQAKLLIVGNHAPSLRGRDPAMERRMRVIPFSHTPKTPNLDLKASLQAEYPAILRWMIDGCVAWQGNRLGTCPAVRGASESYFGEQDSFGLWAAEQCSTTAGAGGSAQLLSNFNNWLRERGERALDSKSFSETLRTRGFTKCHTNKGTAIQGLSLKKQIDVPDEGLRQVETT